MPSTDERGVLRTYWLVAALNLATSSAGTRPPARRDPPAVFHFDALGLGPLADLCGVQLARRSAAPAPSRPAGAAVNPPSSPHVCCQASCSCWACSAFRSISYSGAVQPEADCALGAAAVDVIDEQGPHLLGHGRSVPPGNWRTILDTSGRASSQPHRYVYPSLTARREAAAGASQVSRVRALQGVL
jgi:hypothetical protein